MESLCSGKMSSSHDGESMKARLLQGATVNGADGGDEVALGGLRLWRASKLGGFFGLLGGFHLALGDLLGDLLPVQVLNGVFLAPRPLLGVHLGHLNLSPDLVHFIVPGVGAPVAALVADLAGAVAAMGFVKRDLAPELPDELPLLLLRDPGPNELGGSRVVSKVSIEERAGEGAPRPRCKKMLRRLRVRVGWSRKKGRSAREACQEHYLRSLRIILLAHAWYVFGVLGFVRGWGS